MLKLIISKIKEAILALVPGRVTLPYPFEPHDPEEGYRGYPDVDVDKCIGCGGCAAVCPARCIKVDDIDQSTRHITRLLERCVFCGRCAEVCPEDAIAMTREFELSSDKVREDLVQECEVFMATCKRCGRCYEPPTSLDRIMEPGMRHDTVERGGDAFKKDEEDETKQAAG